MVFSISPFSSSFAFDSRTCTLVTFLSRSWTDDVVALRVGFSVIATSIFTNRTTAVVSLRMRTENGKKMMLTLFKEGRGEERKQDEPVTGIEKMEKGS